jgi:hypothetical protein
MTGTTLAITLLLAVASAQATGSVPKRQNLQHHERCANARQTEHQAEVRDAKGQRVMMRGERNEARGERLEQRAAAAASRGEPDSAQKKEAKGERLEAKGARQEARGERDQSQAEVATARAEQIEQNCADKPASTGPHAKPPGRHS